MGQNELITDKKEIARRYVSGWFWVDVIVTMPWDQMTQVWVPSIKQLASVVKFVRLMKIIRLIRLVKLLKLIKDRKKMIHMRTYLKVSNGIERLIISIFSFMLLCHVVACIWILQAKLWVGRDNWIY